MRFSKGGQNGIGPEIRTNWGWFNLYKYWISGAEAEIEIETQSKGDKSTVVDCV